MGKVDDFLQHYQSEYYDPAAAHEYYLKNRELKGRSTKGMSSTQKETWGYAKSQITIDKKSKVEALQAKTKDTRDRISKKLKLIRNISGPRAEKMRLELRSAIDGVRDAYAKAKEELVVKYEKIYQDEHDKIAADGPGQSKKTGSKKPRSSKTKKPGSQEAKKTDAKEPKKTKKDIYRYFPELRPK